MVERANCPGCGAPLALSDQEAIITCPYCGSDAKVVRRLRVIEPDLPLVEPKAEAVDGSKDYDSWSAERLIHAIASEDYSVEEKVKMGKALDSWSHAKEKTTLFVPFIIKTMVQSSKEVDDALKGILGKLICSKNPKFRLAVINAARKYAFQTPGSKGLLFALSLGNAGTVKLLLDIAEWADSKLADEYAKAALIGVQTAIGRESKRRTICVQILLYRYMEVSPVVQNWIARFLSNHFDVGYRDIREDVIRLVEDCALEKAALAPKLINGLKKCRGAKDKDEYIQRLQQLPQLRTVQAKRAACVSLGRPPDGMSEEDLSESKALLTQWSEDEGMAELQKAAQQVLPYFPEN